jgi:hypothetical protein
MNRRTLITGLVSLLAAPAIIRTPGLLMPIRPLDPLLVGPKFGIKEWLPAAAGEKLNIPYRVVMQDNGPFRAEQVPGSLLKVTPDGSGFTINTNDLR